MCRSEELAALWKDYISADQERKLLLERTYGRRALRVRLNSLLTEGWEAVNTKLCPYCFTTIEVIVFPDMLEQQTSKADVYLKRFLFTSCRDDFSCVILICCVLFCRRTADVS